jgi:hypothetical protein
MAKSTGHSTLDQQLCTFSEPFYSTRKLRLPWEDVRQVQKIEQGQGVQVLTNNDVVYTSQAFSRPIERGQSWSVCTMMPCWIDHQRDNVRHRTPYAARIQAKKFSALVGD